MAGPEQGGRRDDPMAELQRQEEMDAREAQYRRQRRTDAIGLESRILDQRLVSVDMVLPEVVEFLNIPAQGMRSITSYEVEPLTRALMMKAQSSLVEKAQHKRVQVLDQQIQQKMANPHLVSALEKVDEYDPKLGDTEVPLTADEQQALSEYSEVAQQREWMLDGMTNGLATLMSEQSTLSRRVRRLDGRIARYEVREGDLDATERRQYEKMLEEQLAEMSAAELKDYNRLAGVAVEDMEIPDKVLWQRMRGDMAKAREGWATAKVDEFRALEARAGSLSNRDRKMLELMRQELDSAMSRKGQVDQAIDARASKAGEAKEWMNLYRAVGAIVDNINVTDQWRRAWHDIHEGAVTSFVQTRWAEYQLPSGMVALLELPGLGRAMELAFKAIATKAVGRDIGIPCDDLLKRENAVQSDIDAYWLAIEEYVRKGGVDDELFVQLGTQMAGMLFENSLLSGWFGFKRDQRGEIVYKWNNTESAEFDAEAYKYGVIAQSGDGSLYPDRNNDYIKVVATRGKIMKEAANGYPTGLPALVTVGPDYIVKPWIGDQDVRSIVDGKQTLRDVFEKMSEGSRWAWSYKMFRAASVYEQYLTEFTVGLKGFRGVAEEVEFFLKSLSNLASVKKKIEASLGAESEECQRLMVNLTIAVLDAAIVNFANPMSMKDHRSVLANSEQGKRLGLVSFEEDDYARVFVRAGFLDADTFMYIYKVRAGGYASGDGGIPGMGLVKRGEKKGNFTVKEAGRKGVQWNKDKGQIPGDLYRGKIEIEQQRSQRRVEFVKDS